MHKKIVLNSLLFVAFLLVGSLVLGCSSSQPSPSDFKAPEKKEESKEQKPAETKKDPSESTLQSWSKTLPIPARFLCCLNSDFSPTQF